MLRFVPAALAAAALLAALPALAQDDGPIRPAEPGSIEETIGRLILYFVDGRTKDEAMATTNDFNPYAIDGESLLSNVGAFFVNTYYEGEAVHEGELSIYPQFNTPLEMFEASDTTPGIIPFALLQKGTCYGGFVSGYPIPKFIDAVDMTGQICHAAIVEEIVYAEFAARDPSTVMETPTEPTAPSAPARTDGFGRPGTFNVH
jgi:hypothetical protein